MDQHMEKSVSQSKECKVLIVSPLHQENVIHYQPIGKRFFLPTKEEKLRFVQEYIKYRPFLVTGCKNENKSRKIKRQKALIELSRKMNIPGFGPSEVYSKIRNIKSTYFQELKKIKREAAKGRKYVTKIIWFETLHNAYRSLNKRKLEFCEQNENPESSTEIDEEISHSEENDDHLNNMQIFKEENDSNYLEDEEQMNYHCEMSETNVNIGTIRKDDNVDTSRKIGNAGNEFDIFGESVAAQLKNMPLTDALEAQMFIQNYLSNLRLQSLRRQRIA